MRSSATSRSAAASRSTARTAPTRCSCARTPSASRASPGKATRSTAFVVEIQIDAWDRHRLLEDLSRVFSESGANILEARCLSTPPMVKNRFVVEVADTHTLKGAITRLRNIESVFDAYRVTPGAGSRPSVGAARALLRRRRCSARGQDRVARLGDLAEVVAVDLQRQRAPVGALRPSARSAPGSRSRGGGRATCARRRRRARRSSGMSTAASRGAARTPASAPESSAAPSAISIGRFWK